MRRKKEDAEKTKQDILNAATRIFAEKSVAAATLDDIAKAAAVTRGAVYWHFKNKIEIFDELHERLHRPVADMIMEDIEKDHPEPLIQLRDLCARLLTDLEHDEQKRQALTLFLIKCDYAGDLAPYREKHEQKKAEKLKGFARYFEQARKKGKLPEDADPDLLAQAVLCYMKGILHESLNAPATFNLTEKAPRLLDLFFANMTAQSQA